MSAAPHHARSDRRRNYVNWFIGYDRPFGRSIRPRLASGRTRGSRL